MDTCLNRKLDTFYEIQDPPRTFTISMTMTVENVDGRFAHFQAFDFSKFTTADKTVEFNS